MTPKTLRVPKHGEMLLSVHGSPLGVYKEDNMDAIHGMLYFQLTICNASISQCQHYIKDGSNFQLLNSTACLLLPVPPFDFLQTMTFANKILLNHVLEDTSI